MSMGGLLLQTGRSRPAKNACMCQYRYTHYHEATRSRVTFCFITSCTLPSMIIVAYDVVR